MRNQNPLGNLPPKAARMWEHVYESAQDRGLNKGAAAAQAWCSVKRQYYKKGERWRKRKQPLSREEYPPGCEPYRGRRGRSRAANPDDPEESLLTLLDTLRASYDFYREAHWTVHGNDYYGNHLLMQRLYEETAPMVDGLAEMIVGSYGPESIANHESRSDVIMEAVATGYGSDERQPDNVAASLVMAQEVQVAIDESYASLKEAGELTHAWDDFLMSIAQIKATHIYLLRQATDMEPYVELDVAARKLKNKLLR